MGLMECPQHPLKPLNEVTRKCDTCSQVNGSPLAGRPIKRGHSVFRPLDGNTDVYPLTSDGRIADVADYARWLERLFADPIRMAKMNVELARPRGVSRTARGIAMRATTQEPMLTAQKPFAYLTAKPQKLAQVAAIVKRFKVKPNNYKVALGNWCVREWTLCTLKYSTGFVIMDDKGNQSNPFASWHLAKEALLPSGFILIPPVGRQDSI